MCEGASCAITYEPFYFAAAFFAAHRFFRAATIAALPAALSFRLGLDVSATTPKAAGSPLTLAHLRRCPSRMRCNVAALILRLPLVDPASLAGDAGPPFSMA